MKEVNNIVRTKIIRGKVYKHGGNYTDRKIALSRANTMRTFNRNAQVIKEDGLYIVWVHSKDSEY